jgi:hypothetical protein
MLENESADLEADLEALKDVRFDLMAIARRRLNATSGSKMNQDLDDIDKEALITHKHK